MRIWAPLGQMCILANFHSCPRPWGDARPSFLMMHLGFPDHLQELALGKESSLL